MLRKYTPNPTHVVDWGELVVDADEIFEEGPMRIMDSRDHVLLGKTVRLVKVLWQHRGVEEVTWEREDTIRVSYCFLFEDGGAFSLSFDIKMIVAYACELNVYVCVNFGDKILLRGEKYKTREKICFSEKWQKQ